MNQFKKVIFLFLVSTLTVLGQQKITLEDIWASGTFRTKGMDALQSLKNTNQYTVLNYDRVAKTFQIDLYDFATLKKVNTLLDTKNHSELTSIDSYTFNSNETQLLIGLNSDQIYRHSSVADFYIFDIATKSLQKVADYKIQEPTFSPDGKKIAYGYQNNLYVFDSATKIHTQITNDGKKNAIINGITDWVYEEEFAFVKAFDWNSSSTHLAYIKFDETDVPEFSMDVFGKELYPSQEVFKYPKAGEKNALVSLYIYNVATNSTSTINLSQYNDFYIARMKWTNDANFLSIQVLNRHQNNLDLLFVDAISGTTKVVLNEKDAAYIDVTDNLTFLKDNSFIWTSEKDGYNHIYHYDKSGKIRNQITKGNWEVTSYYGFDEKNGQVYYQSVENGSINRDIYKIKLDGKSKVRLTQKAGTNKATFSPNFQYFINSFSSTTEPTVFTLHESKAGKLVQPIVDNTELATNLEKYNLPTKEFFELTTEKGHKLNAYIIKPKDFDVTKKYPLLLFQYSGPGSQQVANQWLNSNDYWHMLLAQQGYLVACVDGRGTGFKGAAFKKVTQKELGKYEVEDQIDAAKVLGNYKYIDKTRIGIWGWSYGGFMSSNCILKGNDVFKTAIAVAPVTNWRFYDSIYTERYQRTPQENPTGYDENSPVYHVNKLKGNLLLVHGTGDDNVHFQNAVALEDALIKANKQFQTFYYPNRNHGISGGNTRLHLYNMLTNFLEKNL